MTPLAEKILELVTTRGHVTFVELDRLEGFSGGDLEISINSEQASNIILWQRLTRGAVDALEELQQAKKIHHGRRLRLTPSLAARRCASSPRSMVGRRLKKLFHSVSSQVSVASAALVQAERQAGCDRHDAIPHRVRCCREAGAGLRIGCCSTADT